MRKGLVVTLGVVALLIAVKPGFSFAPVISCIPDIIVSDAEQNIQTSDQNFFVFSSALNLDDLVRDDDTAKNQLRWSFFESSPGNSIQIAGKNSLPDVLPPTVKDPAGLNLRTGGAIAAVRNKLWSPVTGTLPYPAPSATSMTSLVQLYVSDGVDVSSQAVVIKTVDTAGDQGATSATQKDALIPKAQKSFTFESGQEGWGWFAPGGFSTPANAASGGRLRMTESAAQVPNVYGAWESPRDPAVALKARWGCIMRARFKIFSSVDGRACPGFRTRAIWTRVMQAGSSWISDFLSQDTNDNLEMQVFTSDLDILYVAGREPGTAGQTYTMLYYPQQISSLMTTSAVVYISCDLLDMDTLGNDAGEISLDQVDVDGIARPAVGTGSGAVTTTDFTSWNSFQGLLPGTGANMTGVTVTKGASGVSIVGPVGTKLWNAGVTGPAVALTSGRYYRAVFTCTSTQTPGGNIAPILRSGFVSSRLVWVANKELPGGGTNSLISTTPQEFEMWICAPTPLAPSTTQTEPIGLRFEAYSVTNVDFLTGRNVAGTLSTSRVVLESFPAAP